MMILLAANLLAIVVIVFRFIHPQVIYWLRDIVVAGRVKRDLLAARDGREKPNRGHFAMSLDRSLRYQVSGSSPDAMLWRCTRIRELFGMMSIRKGVEVPDPRMRPDLAGTIMELADMVHSLGSRIPSGYDAATEVIGAEVFLADSIACADGVSPLDTEHTEEWLRTHALSIEQIGELLIAAIYALACRKELSKRAGIPDRSGRRRARTRSGNVATKPGGRRRTSGGP